MITVTMLRYAGCSTCTKALAWLRAQSVQIVVREIVEFPPTAAELEAWVPRSGRTLRQWLNTSGLSYRALGKERITAATDAELVAMLASDGKLVKRPVLLVDSQVVVGFDVRAYERVLAKTATASRARATPTRIRFSVGSCTLGDLLVAATERGVCAILLGDDPQALVQALHHRFPNADLVRADSSFEELRARVVELVENPRRAHNIALDIQGTEFQATVWKALTRIRAGTTMSYAELAQAIGQPSASRAVAGACAANTLAVAIPCHRVVCSDGALSGYRWGVDRKRALLARESAG